MENELRIVGVDPGTTAGVAVLGLDGELVDYTSRRNFSKDRIIQFMVDSGKPLLVAADVAPAPSLVDEIASNTGSVLVAPDRDLEQARKEQLSRDFELGNEDSHVMDAVAAAEYARREYESKLGEIRKRVREAGVEENLDDVTELVVKGSFSISQAISEVGKLDPEEKEQAEDTGSQAKDWERIAEKRKERIDLLESKVSNLQEHIENLDSGGDEVTVDEEELRRRNRLIRDLREELEKKSAEAERTQEAHDQLEEGLERLEQGWIKAPKVENLALTDRGTVFIENYLGERIGDGVSTVLMENPSRELEREGLTVVPMEDVERVVETADSYFVHPGELETEEESERFMEWLEAYRER